MLVATDPSVFNEMWGHFPAVVLATQPGVFSDTSGRLEPCLWPHNRVFQTRCRDIFIHVCADMKGCFCFPDPNQVFYVPKPNQSISKALW